MMQKFMNSYACVANPSTSDSVNKWRKELETHQRLGKKLSIWKTLQVNKHTTTASPLQLKISIKYGSEILKMNGSISRDVGKLMGGDDKDH